MKERLLGKNLAELKEICSALSLPSFTGGQIAQWLYSKRAVSFEEMTNLSKAAREALAERYEIGAVIPSEVVVSRDGTKKYLFPFTYVEAVMIPEEERATLCISSQMGCRMGCKFCMTGRQGFRGNLSAAEILSQFFYIPESERLTNAVFMGMGEPLDNLDEVMRAIDVLTAPWGCGWSPKRITVSTIGVNGCLGKNDAAGKSPLERFLDECKCHLAVSLHNPFPEERGDMMPAEIKFPIEKTLDIIRRYDFTGQRRVSFEYTMFAGLNDNKRHADALALMLRNIECRVNLIRFHDIGDTKFKSSPMPVIEQFKERLCRAGITATVRASRGEDIYAACGMLSGKRSGIIE